MVCYKALKLKHLPVTTSMQRNFHNIPEIMKDCALLTENNSFDCFDGKCNACDTSKIQPSLTQWLHDDDNLKISLRNVHLMRSSMANGVSRSYTPRDLCEAM